MLRPLYRPDEEWSTLKKLMYLQGMGVVNADSKLHIDLTAFDNPIKVSARGKHPEVENCVVHFSPNQDLHGAASAYPAGYGANKLKPNVNLPMTKNGVTITLEGGAFVLNGTCTSTFSFHLDNIAPDWVLIPCEAGSSLAITWMSAGENIPWNLEQYVGIATGGGGLYPGQRLYPSSSFAMVYPISDNTDVRSNCSLRIPSGCVLNNAKVKILMHYGDGPTPTSWVPYENICPIYGWEGCTVTRTGNNLVNVCEENQFYAERADKMIVEYSGHDVTITPIIEESTIWNMEVAWKVCPITEDMVGKTLTVSASIPRHIAIVRSQNRYMWGGYPSHLTTSTNKSYTIKSNDVGYNLGVSFSHTTFGPVTESEIQLEWGNKATKYKEYGADDATYSVVFPYGKNLLDMSAGNIELGKYINNSGTVQSSTSNFYNTKYIPVKPSTKYTISTNTNVSYVSFMEYDESKSFTLRTLFGASQPRLTQATITTRADTAYILIGSNPIGSAITMDDVTAIKWQVEEGENATSYEPYGRVRYAGLVDLKTGDGEVTMAMTTFDGSTPSNKLSITVLTGYTQVSYTPYITEGVAGHDFLCSRFITGSTDGLNHIWGSSAPRMFMGLPDSVTSANDAVAWFADNPTEVCYHLATTVPFHVNPQTFIVEAGKTYWSAEMLSTVDESNLVGNALVDTATVS